MASKKLTVGDMVMFIKYRDELQKYIDVEKVNMYYRPQRKLQIELNKINKFIKDNL